MEWWMWLVIALVVVAAAVKAYIRWAYKWKADK